MKLLPFRQFALAMLTLTCCLEHIIVVGETDSETGMPTAQPTEQPSEQPSAQPTSVPSLNYTLDTSMFPSSSPSGTPSRFPSGMPSSLPTSSPSTPSPTQAPTTANPTLSPTAFPTPVYSTTLIVDVGQTLLNCSTLEYKRTRELSDEAFKQAVHQALDILPDATINILSVTDTSISLHVTAAEADMASSTTSVSIRAVADSTSRQEASVQKAVTVTYLLSVVIEAGGFTSGKAAFDYITSDLQDSISSGEFTTFLRKAGEEFVSPAVMYATAAKDGLNIHTDYLEVNESPKPTLQPTFRYGDSDTQENSLEIIGPAVALVLLILISIIVYYRCIRQGSDGDSFIPISQDAEGYDEIELMEKKAQMVSLSQHGTNPLHRLRQKNKRNRGYANIINTEEDTPQQDHDEENGSNSIDSSSENY